MDVYIDLKFFFSRSLTPTLGWTRKILWIKSF